MTGDARGRSPFRLDDDTAYRAWRERKLADAPTSVDALVVDVRDPRALRAAERDALIDRCSRFNMAIYASAARDDGKAIAIGLATQVGLVRLDANRLADPEGISSLSTRGGGERGDFIPYTDRPLGWHTDGYYNAPGESVDAMVLHCVRPAARGGDNGLMDHEIAYILLRDIDPAHVRALSAADAMCIPARIGGAEAAAMRPARSGPVFSLTRGGKLRMRYTHRTTSIGWRDDRATRAAVSALRALLDQGSRHALRVRLEAGMGIVCNNVLHCRSGFVDDPQAPRLVYRARYRDRIEDRRTVGAVAVGE